MSAMKMSWQTETGRLLCRWSEAAERVQYDSCWIQDASREVHLKNPSPLVPDFTRLSPVGGKEWYALDRLRYLHFSRTRRGSSALLDDCFPFFFGRDGCAPSFASYGTLPSRI